MRQSLKSQPNWPASIKIPMLDFSFGELIVVIFVALVVVGPKELPHLMYKIGRWLGQVKGVGDEFKSGFKSAMRDASFEAIKKDIQEIHEEIQYIKDENGISHRVYDISDYLVERGHAPMKPLIEKNDT